MQKLANHKNFQLRDDAAASWDRFERDHGVRVVSSAYRSQADQNVILRRWATGGKFNRPPYLYEPAAVSKHTSGVALDTPNAEAVSKLSSAYGWRFLFAYDKVHLEYDPAYDQHKTVTPAAKSARSTIKRGSTGKDVRDLQTILNTYHGTHLTVDGNYGVDTRDRVAEFQDGHGLNPDGVVGAKTWSKLGQ